ncbi:EthD family reductase [Crossiella sp. CA198]|uniref:EthD family reductase n=1 Tax=Crossiella sp. CA198 TaxID=3455607 RepID=UPI003F8D5135
MHVLTALYGQPADPAAFDEYFIRVHAPLAQRVLDRGLRGATITRFRPEPDGTPAAYHLKVDIAADSAEVMDAALASPDGLAAAEDVVNFATGGVVILRGEVD